MGALSYAALGGLAGLGKGAAALGESMAREAEAEKKLAQQLKLEEMRQDAQDKRLEARLAVTAAKTGTGRSGGGSKGGGGGDILDVLRDPEAFALLSGHERGGIDDYISMQKGVMPTVAMVIPADVDEGDAPVLGGPTQTVQVAKYTAGSAAALRAEKVAALYDLIKKINPAHADDVAKGQLTDQQRANIDDYVKNGTERSAQGALLTGGHALFDASGNRVTGKAVAGGVSGSAVTENLAQANQATAGAAENYAQRNKAQAETGKVNDERKGDTGPKTALARVRLEQAAAAREQSEIAKARDLLFKQFEAGTLERAPGDKDRKAAYNRRDRELESMMAIQKKREVEALKREEEAREAPTPSSSNTPSKANAPKAEVKGAIAKAVEKGNPVKPAAPIPLPAGKPADVAKQLQPGRVYVTPRGALRWNGTAFEST